MNRRWVGAGVGGLLAVIGVLTFWLWLVSPSTTDPDGHVEVADAVVLFVGGRGERLDMALDLLDDEVAPALVIPNGWALEWPAANAVCASTDRSFEVFCPVPDPDNTRGEAQQIAAISEEQGWDSLLYVTSDYHVARAGHLLDECFDGRIRAVSADSDLGGFDWLRQAAREWVGNVIVRSIERGC